MKIRLRTMLSVIIVSFGISLVTIATVAKAEGLESYNQKGLNAYNAARYRHAIRIWEKGLSLAKQQGNDEAMVVFLENIGLVYANLGQNKKGTSLPSKGSGDSKEDH